MLYGTQSGRRWARRWPFSWAGCLFFVLLLALSLPTFPIWAQNSQPTEPLSTQDYLNSKADLAIVRQSLATYAEALQQAKLDVQTATDELAKAKAERETQSKDSAQSSKELQDKVDRLTQRLTDSEAILTEAQKSYDLKMAEYQTAVATAQTKARALERERDFWRAVGITGTVTTVIAIIVAVAK